MKKTVFVAIVLLLLNSNSLANDIPSAILKKYQQIITLVKENNSKELSKLIEYPLKSENPLPDIATAKEFISYYSTIFDTPFKQKLQKYVDSYVIEHHGAYGLVGGPFNGDIWISEDGKIMAINYLSSEESKLKDQLIIKLKNQLHPSVRDWEENVVVGKSKNLTIRVDRTDKGLRYVSWSKGRLMSEKPDLILFNGIEEPQGTMGE